MEIYNENMNPCKKRPDMHYTSSLDNNAAGLLLGAEEPVRGVDRDVALAHGLLVAHHQRHVLAEQPGPGTRRVQGASGALPMRE